MYKYNVGYATGVFDLFHIGHLNLLKNAKKYCKHLIVGVSIDEIITYKEHKPIIPFEERINIVEAIRYVDEAIPQTSLDKIEAWERLKYNVLFHGDDLIGDPVWERYRISFEERGVDLIYLPYTTNISTSEIRERIIKQNDKKI